ncbi:tetratricopeptide repeat-containing protein [Oceanispirochaeta sp. M1]|nr:LA2681 family HEPN domain-containing protein [Oceanispirochaeta sp. M1]RDG31844.1 tetratricopeptide repeat-containing protein [Oceanispirochaeta sp. M1]
MYNPVVENFTLQIESARSLMKDGQYRKAFDLIVNQDVQSLPDLLGKIECLVDIGFVLRDEKILRYSLYLLEKHGSEVLEVADLAPRYFLNLGHQYANMVTLSSFGDEHYGFFKRVEQVKARSFYEKVLSYDSVSDEIAFEAYKGLGQMYQSSGRGLEALSEYQKALKLKPASREILHEKIRLMLEYSIPSLPNREEFLQEAWALMEKSISYREEEDDQEDVILKTRLLNCGIQRHILETPGEYPIRSVITNSEEEHFFTKFCVTNSLYLNLCTFCRKCDFTMGDTMALSSSSLTIMQGQKKRFVRLRDIYEQLQRKYTSGRYILSDTLNSGRHKEYLHRVFTEDDSIKTKDQSSDFFQLASAFQTAWSLWDLAAEFISVYWDLEPSSDIHTLFYKGKEIREEWYSRTSPSLHSIFDLYSDCLVGKDKSLSVTQNILHGGSSDWNKLNTADLKQYCILLFRQMNRVIQYLGIMHERNEYSSADWDFPRPLYNFVIIKEDINSK